MDPALEIVRFRVSPDRRAAFIAKRRAADDALAGFAGFLGSELAEGEDGAWTLIVRWASRAEAAQAQRVTLASPGLPDLNAWTSLANEFVDFETVDVRHGVRHDDEEANHAIGLRFARDGIGKGDLAVFDELVDADVCVTTGLSPTAPIRGREAYKQIFADFADAWPVRDFVIDESFAADNKVVVRFTATTVFLKDYYGVKANRAIAPVKEIHLYTLRDGRIVENIVGAVNLPFEFLMYDALKDAVLGGLATAS